MRRTWKPILLVVMSVAALNGCATVTNRPDELPGQPRDPGRFEETAADSAPTKREEDEQRQRANAKRLYEFESGCTIVSFFFEVILRDSVHLCAGSEQVDRTPPVPRPQLL